MNNEKLMTFVSKYKLRFLILIISGALMALPIVFPKFGFLGWIGGVPAAYVFISAARDKTVKLRRMYGYGFVYFISFYAVTFHWFIAMYPLSFIGEMSAIEAMSVVFVATFGLSALQASFSGFFGVILAVIARRGFGRRFPILVPVTAAFLYPCFEWAQTFTWAGVPWARLALGQTEAAVMLKSVSLFGSYFLTALIIAVNFLLAEFLLADDRVKKSVCIAASAAIVGVNACVGAILLIADKDEGEGITVAAVQPNISSTDPWGFDTVDKTAEVLAKYTREAAAEGAKLVVWPETALPLDFDEDSDAWEFSCELAKECGVTIVVGAFTEGETADRNSLIFVSSEGEVYEPVYSKRRLVPFGEFVPWRGFFEKVMPQLVDLLVLSDDLEESDSSDIVDTEVGKLGGIICFDSIYETLTLQSVRDGAELIVLSTNDSWFTGSKAVEIHALQSKLRATETGRYLVRSASTGISMIVTPDGEVLDQKGDREGGYVIATVYPRENRTLYSIIGNLFIYISIFAVSFMIGSAIVDAIMKKKTKV